MEIQALSNVVSHVLAAVFAGFAVLRFLQPFFQQPLGVRTEQVRWPRLVGGMLRAIAALFLALPQTRIWGGLLAASIAFLMVVEQLAEQRFSRALPGILVMVAIPIVLASGPLP
ncbi:MAG TPA: hypothetical protein VMF58_13790 [Rhizomicrobium sp.]|nr:hypothetical protein [Rhizomicrobium sp.]